MSVPKFIRTRLVFMATEQTSEKVDEMPVQSTVNEGADLNMTDTEDSAKFLEF